MTCRKERRALTAFGSGSSSRRRSISVLISSRLCLEARLVERCILPLSKGSRLAPGGGGGDGRGTAWCPLLLPSKQPAKILFNSSISYIHDISSPHLLEQLLALLRSCKIATSRLNSNTVFNPLNVLQLYPVLKTRFSILFLRWESQICRGRYTWFCSLQSLKIVTFFSCGNGVNHTLNCCIFRFGSFF